MNTQVSFKIAKLLKEKGFDSKVRGIYCIKAITPFREGRSYLSGYGIDENFIYAPTIAEVVMWLYKKHGIWIEVYYDNSRKEFYTVLDGEEYKFNSPIEAYKAAIDYILNNEKIKLI